MSSQTKEIVNRDKPAILAPLHRRTYEQLMLGLVADYREFVESGGQPEDYEWRLPWCDLMYLHRQLTEDVLYNCHRRICDHVFGLVEYLGIHPDILDAINGGDAELWPFWGRWPARFRVLAPEIYKEVVVSS